MFPGKICDISYSTFLEGYISNNNDKESMEVSLNWYIKWHCFSLMDNTAHNTFHNTYVSTLCLYAHVIAIKMGVSCIYAYSLFVWDSRDIRGLYFSNFSLEKYILVKM